MLNKRLAIFFQQYSHVLATYSVDNISSFYRLPCLLSTPDKLLLLQNQQAFKESFNETFTLLSAANISAFKALDTSYQIITPNLILVNIVWQFFDQHDALYTEFSASYQLLDEHNNLKIIQVISQDVEQALMLTHRFTLQEER